MVERHLKFIKGLVSQRTNPRGSMVEGYMVYQTMVYITKYLPKFASNIYVDHIWDLEPCKQLEGEYLMGKGRLRKVRGNYKMLLQLINSYSSSILFIYNWSIYFI